MAKKKFIIIQPGTKLFPENGKKRVRVFQDENDDGSGIQGLPPGLTEELNEYVKAKEEETKARGENQEAIEGETKAAKELNIETSINQNRAEELINTLKDQFQQYVNLEGATGKYAAAQSEILTLQKELAQAEAEGRDVKKAIIQSLIEQAEAARQAAIDTGEVSEESQNLGKQL